ncbi:MAG: phosphoadenosine phosphosulfate reductase family protein [Firmicutes bacterium]|nr:phosphoadenosine phosphosulfate reductase family protein [Bacillota bacterium]
MDNRENARIVEMCYKNHTTLINPIIDWTTEEVWEFIKEYEVPYCSLYDEGFKRLGCIGCPMGSKAQRLKELERWPKYYNLYMIAFEKMIQNRGGGRRYQTPEEMMTWWLSEGSATEASLDQISLTQEQ